MFRGSDLKVDTSKTSPSNGTSVCPSPSVAQIWKSAKRWVRASMEPSLDELLAEPIIRLLMARDGWPEERLRRLINSGKVL